MADFHPQALYLEYFTVAYNTAEAIASIGFGYLAGSIALIGFGLDSIVESLSGLVLIWRLRKHGVVGKFVEFYGDGLSALPLADRATIANMGPEYGATIAICPIDEMTLDYLRISGRDEHRINLAREYLTGPMLMAAMSR